MTCHNQKASFTKSLIDPNLLKKFLIFPSGLTLEQAKQKAKTLKKAQNISQSEAMKYICWGNGLADIRDFSQAIPALIKNTFDLTIDEFGVLEFNNVVHGYWLKEKGQLEFMRTRSRAKANISEVISQLAEYLIVKRKNKNKAKNFLEAVKDCIYFLDHDFYSIKESKPIELVTSIHEIKIDLEALLFGKSESKSYMIMSTFLASCYNNNETARLLMSHSLYVTYELQKEVNSSCDKCTYDIADESTRRELSVNSKSYALLGGAFLSLDKSNKNIIKRLLNNYHGW